ncbi:MAG: protein-glutamate O-methyltransferase CheR [Acidaminobacteraceae bacterium]
MNIKESEFQKISSYVKSNFGINLTKRKKTLVRSRLQNTLADLGYKTFDEYYNYVVGDTSGEAILELINKISTNHTYFYREEKHFDFMQNTVLPLLYKREKAAKDIRIWSAGCSSGDEAYTLAIILEEFLKGKGSWNKQILATDISQNALAKARNGIYKADQIDKLPEEWKQSYFEKQDEGKLAIKKNIKSEVIFRSFNLMNKFPFKKKFHVIFCRNVMIYFDNETKIKLVNAFYESLEDGGYLFIGHSETIERGKTKFELVKPSIYRKDC